MNHIVTITSQGQITIPAALRREIGLKKMQKLSLREESGFVIMEPVKDFLELGGSLHKYAHTDKSIDKVVELEKNALEEGRIEDYKKSLKRESKKLLVIKP